MANKADIDKLEKKLEKEKQKVLDLQRTVRVLKVKLIEDKKIVEQAENLVQSLRQFGNFCTKFDLESAIESNRTFEDGCY